VAKPQTRNERPHNQLAELIDDVLHKKKEYGFSTQQEIGRAIGVDKATFSRSVQDHGTLTVEQSLRLAHLLRMDPVSILRAARRGDLADVVAAMMHTTPSALTRGEEEHLQLWRQASPTTKISIRSTLSLDVVMAEVLAHVRASGSRRGMQILRRLARQDRAIIRAAGREDALTKRAKHELRRYTAGSPTPKTGATDRSSGKRRGSASRGNTKSRA